MNLFAVNDNPVLAALDLCDQHMVMAKEAGQICSTVAHLRGVWVEGMSKPTHENHPVVRWANAHPANWSWALRHGLAVCWAYHLRYGKQYKSAKVLRKCKLALGMDDWRGHTPFAQAMDQYPECKGTDSVEAYRRFYRTKTFARWKHSPKPTWL